MSPLANWPNDPYGTPGLPMGRSICFHDSRVASLRSAFAHRQSRRRNGQRQFHKVDGQPAVATGHHPRPAGSPERDSRSQAGRYLVLEVSDRGDIGIWQREQTRWIDVVPWTHSDAVRTGDEANTLVVYTVETAFVRSERHPRRRLEYDALPPAAASASSSAAT